VKQPKQPLPVIGWREWVALPDLGVGRIKVKVDTGARSSAIHAWGVERLRRGGRDLVRFVIHPLQRDVKTAVVAESALLDERLVRSSSGTVERRLVIETSLLLLGEQWPIELTLATRDQMGFRMLLGRQAIRRRLWVDSGGSYYNGRPLKKKVKKKSPGG
jgi:hypothetical protein